MPDRPDSSAPSSRGPVIVGAVLVGVFLVVYGPDCGTGFVSDDFAWVLHSRMAGADDLIRQFQRAEGFYRPLVSLSFAVNHLVFGLWSRGYGWTNLLLALACGAAVAMLARQWRLPLGTAVTAAALWLFNFHGINMGVLWLSGRTSLLVTLFGILAAIAFLRGRPAATAGAVAAALLSKEEAVVLPALFTTWAIAIRQGRARGWWDEAPTPSARALAAAWAALPLYFGLRLGTDAFWFSTAPTYYQPSWALPRILENVPQYADRALTTSTLAVVLAWLFVRRAPAVPARTRLIGALASAWVVFGFAITVFLPVRSSLYAVLPSVGAAVLAAAFINDLAATLPARRQRHLTAVALVLLVLLVPVYRSRNVRWTELGELSTSVIAQLRGRQPDLPASVVIVDDGTTRANLTNAWGQLVPEMVQLVFDGRLDVTVVPAGSEVRADAGRAVLRLRGGQLEP